MTTSLPDPRLVNIDQLKETTLSSDLVYQGNFLQVYSDKVTLPNGATSRREILRHPGAAAIIPVLDNGEIILVRQFRYALNQVFIELPAGKIDPNEDVLNTAKRELQEETGYVARDWHELLTIHNAIGYCDERIVLYAAQGLSFTRAQLDDNEFLEVFSAPLDQAIAWIEQGIITDVKTSIGLYRWRDFLKANS